MNKTELIERVSSGTELPRRDVEKALDGTIDTITAAVRANDPVRITGFGTFKLKNRPARTGRNPQTGASVKIKASKGIGFTPGATLKSNLNSKSAPKKAAAKAPAKATRTTARATKAPAKTAPARKAAATRAPARRATKSTATKATARKR